MTVPTLIGRGLTSEFARTTHGTAKLCECEWRTSDPERVARLCWPMVNFSATPAIEASTTLSEMDDRSAESPISVFDPQETLVVSAVDWQVSAGCSRAERRLSGNSSTGAVGFIEPVASVVAQESRERKP
ncbi:MAG: hypothetical protein ACLGH1_13325 [Gammaproteobacteria bacterium]